MNKRNMAILLGAAAAFQFAVLVGMVIRADWPLWNGQEIRLRLDPIDPRSLFRGDYLDLNYDIGAVTLPKPSQGQEYRYNEPVYVRVRLGEDGLYHYAGASLRRPSEGIFLRGRLQGREAPDSSERNHRVRYGIEAYFVPRERAQQLELELAAGGIAVVKVMDSGRAALETVLPLE